MVLRSYSELLKMDMSEGDSNHLECMDMEQLMKEDTENFQKPNRIA